MQISFSPNVLEEDASVLRRWLCTLRFFRGPHLLGPRCLSTTLTLKTAEGREGMKGAHPSF